MRKHITYRFTLAEILVSMAVFSILLVLIMQFFTGARTLWTANEKRAAIYADAGAALDLMTTLLQSTFCIDNKAEDVDLLQDETPFEVAASAAALRSGGASAVGNDHMIVFLSNSLMNLSEGSSIRYLSFSRDTPDPAAAGVTNNVLYLKVFSDQQNNFASCFYEWTSPVTSKEGALTLIKNAMRGFSRKANSKQCKPILRNVTGLKFVLLKLDGTEETVELKKTPVAIRIELSLMENEETIRKYLSLSGTAQTDFQKQHEYTFRRTVWLGKRDAKL